MISLTRSKNARLSGVLIDQLTGRVWKPESSAYEPSRGRGFQSIRSRYSERFSGHEHEWRRYSCTYGRESGGILWVPRIRVTCSEGHPVYDIMWQVQYGFLLSSTDEERREFFRLLDSGDSELSAKAVETGWEGGLCETQTDAE